MLNVDQTPSTPARLRLLTPSLLVVLAAAIPACGDSEGGADDEAGDTSSDDDDGTDGGEEERAYVVVNRILSPEGRSMFISVLPDLNHGQIDVGAAVERSGFARTRNFEGKIYSFDSETGVITRFVVNDDRSLSPDTLSDGSPAQVSFANLGITRFTTTMVFVNSQRAFYFATSGEDLVIEWNPAQMTITASYPGGFARDGISPISGRIAVTEDYVVLPLSWSNTFTFDFVAATGLAVIDLNATASPTIIEEDRCVAGSSAFADGDHVYVIADTFGGIAPTVSDEEPPPPCLLRWQPGADSFDPDFYVDLAERTGYGAIASGLGRGDGTFVTQAYTSDVDRSTLGPVELLQGPYWQYMVVEIDSDTATLVDDLEPASHSPSVWLVDGEYVVARTDDAIATSFLQSIDAQGRATELLTAPGDLFWVDRIR